MAYRFKIFGDGILLRKRELSIKGIEYLQKYCKENNITAYKLSKVSGVSNTYCYKLLRGKMSNPSISTINRISMALGLNISDFLK
ncbi:helix-turn-helix domain-containing protein [Clostridium cibarium]|uniref:Helix-turn-helix transcriptional regulator n=1 Tax=Clostridium cibarium TaxID=2762247 RepID=A0ABR8PV65_9CLOT|nr:helix-turn-helix transcriptional regulator [Clostridium cibarium]